MITLGNCLEGRRRAWQRTLGVVATIAILVFGGAATARGVNRSRPYPDRGQAVEHRPVVRVRRRFCEMPGVCCLYGILRPSPSPFAGTLGPFLARQPEPSIRLETVLEHAAQPPPARAP